MKNKVTLPRYFEGIDKRKKTGFLKTLHEAVGAAVNSHIASTSPNRQTYVEWAKSHGFPTQYSIVDLEEAVKHVYSTEPESEGFKKAILNYRHFNTGGSGGKLLTETDRARKTRGENYYTDPSSWSIITGLGYLYIVGYRWKRYNTDDGMVAGFEKLVKGTPFPIPIRSEVRVLKDFEELFEMDLVEAVSDERRVEFANNTEAFYISIK